MLLCRNGCSLTSLLFNIAHTVVTSLSHHFRTERWVEFCHDMLWSACRHSTLEIMSPLAAKTGNTETHHITDVSEFKSCWWSWKRGWVQECSLKSCWSHGYLVLRAEYVVPSCKASLPNKTPWFSCSSSRSRGKNVSRKTHIGLAKGNYYIV